MNVGIDRLLEFASVRMARAFFSKYSWLGWWGPWYQPPNFGGRIEVFIDLSWSSFEIARPLLNLTNCSPI